MRDGLGLIKSSAEIEKLAATVPDRGGVYLVPAFAGVGAPHWDQHARGTMTGLARGTTAGHLAAVLILAPEPAKAGTPNSVESCPITFGVPALAGSWRPMAKTRTAGHLARAPPEPMGRGAEARPRLGGADVDQNKERTPGDSIHPPRWHERAAHQLANHRQDQVGRAGL